MSSIPMSRAESPTSAVKAALMLLGFSAVTGQIVLLRELIVVFNGNEISLGIILATWLFGTACGSGVSGFFSRWGNNARGAVAVLECLLGFSLPMAIWSLCISRSFFQSVPGEFVGPVPMLLTSLVSLSLFCFAVGALFVAAARCCQQERAVLSRRAASTAYLVEAIGSACGGIVASIVLLRFLESFQIALLIALLNLCMATVLFFHVTRKQLVGLIATAVLFAIPLLLYVAPLLERSAQARLWRGFQLVESRDTIYGKLAVIETGDIRSIYDNGVILANAPDENAAEESVHYALLEHPAPRRILMIGGGVNGGISQALQHPTVERIDYVELDPALISMARQFFPAQFSPAVSDSRVHLHYADGRRYLKTVNDKFDVIILNAPGPQTAQMNRFYTVEFFQSARDHLAPGGVLALQLRSSEDYISPGLAEFLRCIQHTLQEVFPSVAAIPGDPIHFFAAVQPGVLTDDPQTLIARLKARKLKTQYVREYFLPYRMSPDRMAQLREQLRPLSATPINRDFAPIAYYFDVVLWSSQFNAGYAHGFQRAAHIAFSDVMDAVLAVTLLAAILLAFACARKRRARFAAAYCVAAAGFTLMAQQMFLLLAFQSIHGYVYHQLAILIAMCMAGIAFGSWLGLRHLRSGKSRRSSDSELCRVMTVVQLILALSVPVLIFVVSLLAKCSAPVTTWLAAQIVFPSLAALCGMLGGYQFPIATEVYLHERNSQKGLGVLYALDLLGGCAGALVLSSFLIPVFGFWKTAWLTAAVNLAPSLLTARASRKQ